MDGRIFREYPTSALRKHMLHTVLPVSYLSPDKICFWSPGRTVGIPDICRLVALHTHFSDKPVLTKSR
jgi:hypothetical protein